MKKLLSLLTMISLLLSVIIVSIAGCGAPSASLAEATGSQNEGQGAEQNGSALPAGFPTSIPIYPGAVVLETEKGEEDGKTTYLVRLECSGDIEEVSQWYDDALNTQCEVGSVSSGDMGDWSEYYAEATTGGNFFTVYLYQDEGSDRVSIDINTKSGEAERETVAEAADTEQYQEDPGETPAQTIQSYSGELEDAVIAFVCASVGCAWNVVEHFPGLDIRVFDEYQFDKGYRIREILESVEPDIIIIKECAAYFPPESQGSSMQAYQDLIRDWVNLCRGQGVIPVLTTVVPIDPDNPSNAGQGQLDSILDFNDWIRQYCSDENISVLDLEEALRISTTDRSLNPVYDSGDGLHPNDRAYTEKLDHILIPALESALETGH